MTSEQQLQQAFEQWYKENVGPEPELLRHHEDDPLNYRWGDVGDLWRAFKAGVRHQHVMTQS